MSAFACIANGYECWSANARVARHRHDQAYAAIILSGCYEECGSLGRFRVGPGDVVLHGRFEAHLDRFGAKGANILNLVIPETGNLICSGLGHVRNVDAVAKAAEADIVSACLQLREEVVPVANAPGDWPDQLAADLSRNPQLSLGDWALRHGLAAESLSRGFQKVFAVTPAAFRAEARTRSAFARILAGGESLAAIAAESGFADQAHMSRAMKSLTGQSPGHWQKDQIRSRRAPVQTG